MKRRQLKSRPDINPALSPSRPRRNFMTSPPSPRLLPARGSRPPSSWATEMASPITRAERSTIAAKRGAEPAALSSRPACSTASDLLLRVFKGDGELELCAPWTNRSDQYRPIKTYPICAGPASSAPTARGDCRCGGCVRSSISTPASPSTSRWGIDTNASDRVSPTRSTRAATLTSTAVATIGCMPIATGHREVYLIAGTPRPAGGKN